MCEPYVVFDRQYRVLAANSLYRERTGVDRVVGRYCYDISHHYPVPCDQAGEKCPLSRSLVDPMKAMAECTDRALIEAIGAHRGSRKALAEKLGMSERTLYRRISALRHQGVRGIPDRESSQG